MKIFLISISALIFFAGCKSNNTQNATLSDSISSDSLLQQKTYEICFQRLEGSSNQDTSTLHLIIDNEQVSGDFNHIPYQKDSRKGTVKGLKNADIIKGVWTYMQEGVTDTLSVEFKLSGNQLLQKTFGVDENTGRQKLTDTSAFSILYTKIDCN